ncbi:MAG TPA: ester cyclase [Ignavibacteria bacterium]|nr:ester cyclase [Ignavibacteria bacterium]
MDKDELKNFGMKYAEAWSSQKAWDVTSFFSESGSLSVNSNPPAIGRAAISVIADGFMTAFPDMTVSMDKLTETSDGIEFHWTLRGTNTGPEGTGNKVEISGKEIWEFDNDGLIKNSRGSYDAEEYNRQLRDGVK